MKARTLKKILFTAVAFGLSCLLRSPAHASENSGLGFQFGFDDQLSFGVSFAGADCDVFDLHALFFLTRANKIDSNRSGEHDTNEFNLGVRKCFLQYFYSDLDGTVLFDSMSVSKDERYENHSYSSSSISLGPTLGLGVGTTFFNFLYLGAEVRGFLPLSTPSKTLSGDNITDAQLDELRSEQTRDARKSKWRFSVPIGLRF